MGEALIKQIQDTVIKYANIISNVVNVDVEIVDTDFYRIAGTGIYKDKIDEDISDEAFVYTEVIKTGKHHIIENPGKHPLCSQCEHRECCVEKMQISTPIKFNDEIIGVIGLICSCEEQKVILLEKMETYIEFLYQIADFISAKLFEHLEAERDKKIISLFKQIIDSMDNGVMVVNIDGKIFHMNNSAMKQLKLTPSHINENVEIISKNEFIMDKEEFTVKIESKEYCLLGQLLPMTPIIPDCNRIFIFNQIKKLKADAYKLTNAHQVVKVESILGQSKSMISLKDRIKKIAASKSTVLITGESGTGKELIARAIHSESDRSDKPFNAINCGAIPDALLESELFGYVKGAFSGANPNGRIGKFELANKGVIFLDEIGDMPLHLQVKILRILQERTLVRIGSNQLIDLDIRVIAATNKDLKKLIKENKFREDLYYRLNVIPIHIPALKERTGDVEIIIMKFIERYSSIFNKYIHTIEPEAKKILINYSWPGNIRELENTVEYMINLADERGVITVDMIPHNIVQYKAHDEGELESNDRIFDKEIRPLKDVEKEYILKALDTYGHDTKGKKIAAKKLGIGIATLYRKLDCEK